MAIDIVQLKTDIEQSISTEMTTYTNVLLPNSNINYDLTSLKFVDENNDFKSLYFTNDNKSEMKSKVKEFNKSGTITFVTIGENNKISNIIYKPKYVKVSKLIDMYVRENEQNIPKERQVAPTQDREVS